jgi:hypothetical protein
LVLVCQTRDGPCDGSVVAVKMMTASELYLSRCAVRQERTNAVGLLIAINAGDGKRLQGGNLRLGGRT